MSYMVYAVILVIMLIIAYASAAGAPWVPARRADIEQLLNDAGLQKDELFVELGCGDGRLLRAAHRRGARVVGYELNPILWLWAFLCALPQRTVRVKFGNFWSANLSEADVVLAFLVPRTMPRLSAKARAEMKTGARLVSYIFPANGLKQMHKGRNWYVYQANQKK